MGEDIAVTAAGILPWACRTPAVLCIVGDAETKDMKLLAQMSTN